MGGGSPTPTYLKRTYLESIPVHSSPVDATKRRVEVLGYVEFTELLANRNNWNGGLLIHMSLVRVQPWGASFIGLPVFYAIPLISIQMESLTAIGRFPALTRPSLPV